MAETPDLIRIIAGELAAGWQFCEAGDLLSVLRRRLQLGQELARFYAAETLLALHHLHTHLHIIYRDLKPENVGG